MMIYLEKYSQVFALGSKALMSTDSKHPLIRYLLILILLFISVSQPAWAVLATAETTPEPDSSANATPKIKFSKIKPADKQAVIQDIEKTLAVELQTKSITNEEQITISKQFVQRLAAGDERGFIALLDKDKMVKMSLALAIQKLGDLKLQRNKILLGIDSIPSSLYRKIGSRGHIKFLRLVKHNDSYRGLIRIIYNTGELSYLELITQRNSKNEIKIIDFYDAMLGRSYTTIASQMLITPTVKKLNNTDKIIVFMKKNMTFQKRYAEMIRYYQKAKYQKALDSFQHLPASFKATKNALLLRIQIAKAHNSISYREALTLLENKYAKLPNLALLLADHYYFTKQYPRALKAIEQYSAHIGGDIALDSLRVKVKVNHNKFAQAISIGEAAIKKDNSYEDIYWLMLKAYLHSYQYQQVGAVLDVLLDKFNVKFDIENFYKDPFYREYGYSNQFKKWKASRQL